MRGQRLFSSISGIALLSITTTTLACMSVPCGWYVEVNGGSTHLSNAHFQSLNFVGSHTSTSGLGGNANVGYKFMPYLTAELGYTQYASTTLKTNNGTKAGTIRYYSYDVAAKGIVPIQASGFEVFAKLGVQRLNARLTVHNNFAGNFLNRIGRGSTSHSTTGLYYGAGAQYYFMPELAGVVQWQRAQGNNTTGTMDLYSVGISFIFD